MVVTVGGKTFAFLGGEGASVAVNARQGPADRRGVGQTRCPDDATRWPASGAMAGTRCGGNGAIPDDQPPGAVDASYGAVVAGLSPSCPGGSGGADDQPSNSATIFLGATLFHASTISSCSSSGSTFASVTSTHPWRPTYGATA
jgi:hypothetical protein